MEHIVGGVNSPSRGYQAVGGGAPTVMERAEGAYFWDVDGNKYIDYLGSIRPNNYRSCTSAYHRSNHDMQQKQVFYMEHQHDMKLNLLKC